MAMILWLPQAERRWHRQVRQRGQQGESPEQAFKAKELRSREEQALWLLAQLLPEAFDTMPDAGHDVTQRSDIGRTQMRLKFLE